MSRWSSRTSHRTFRVRLQVYEVIKRDEPRPGGADNSQLGEKPDELVAISGHEVDFRVNVMEAARAGGVEFCGGALRSCVRMLEDTAWKFVKKSIEKGLR